jgi:hypothetical protein
MLLNSKGLVAVATLFIYFFYLFFLLQSHTFIITFVQYPQSSISIFFIAFAQREKPPWGAEPGFELGPAVQQASAPPTELCCTLLSYAAPY